MRSGNTTFRLAGFGGAGVFLRPVIVPTSTDNDESIAMLSVDVGLLSRTSFTEYLALPVSMNLPSRLSTFCLAAAAEQLPEKTVAAFSDDVLGLRIEVKTSDEMRVGLLISLGTADAESEHSDGLDFETSRAALVQAAQEARLLDQVEDDPGGAVEPPVDWAAE